MDDGTIMMALQLIEEFSGRVGTGQVLSKQEVLTYEQLLTTTQTYFRHMDRNMRTELEEVPGRDQ